MVLRRDRFGPLFRWKNGVGVRLGLSLSLGMGGGPGPTLSQIVLGAGLPLALWEAHGNTTRSTTPAASGTATVPAVTWTFSGDAATRAIVARIECTTGGDETAARFRYGTTDATGTTTWIESSKAQTAGVITCIGAMAGFTINVPSATYVSDQVWQDVAASVADLGSAGATMTAPSAARAPFLRMGPGGNLCWANDSAATARSLVSTLDLAAPLTTPFWKIDIYRPRTAAAANRVVSGAGAGAEALHYVGSDGKAYGYNGATIGNAANAINSWVRHATYFSGSASDSQRYSSGRYTGNAGNSNPTNNYALMATAAGSGGTLVGDLLMSAIWLGLPTNLDAIDQFLLAKYPGLLI